MPAAAYFPAPIESSNSLRDLPGRRLNLLYPHPAIDSPNYHYYDPSGYCIPLVHPTPPPPPPAQFAYSDYPYFYPYPHAPQYRHAPFLIPTGSPHFHQQLDDAPPFPIPAYPQYAVPHPQMLVSAPRWHLQEPRNLAPLKSRSDNALEDAVEGRGSHAEPFYTVVPVHGPKPDANKSTYEVPPYIVVPKTADENKSSNPLQWRGLPVIWRGGVPYGLVPLTNVHDGQEEDLLEPAKACIHQYKLANQAGAGAEIGASQLVNSAPDSSPTTTIVENGLTTSAKQAHPCVIPATETQIHGAEQHAKKNKEDISKVNESKPGHEVSKVVAEHKPMHIAWDGGVPYIVLPRVKEQRKDSATEEDVLPRVIEQGKESATEVDKKKTSKKNGNQVPSKVIPAVQQYEPKMVIPVVEQDDPKKVIPSVHQDNPKSLHPNILSQEENSEQKFLNVPSVINVSSRDGGKEPSSAAPSTHAQMPTDQHPSTEEHLQPPIKKKSSFTLESAALCIQAVYRGHVVRIAQPLKHLKIIKDVQASASDIYKQMENKACAFKDPVGYKRISESILGLLLKLDSVRGALPYVRECRKMVARELCRAIESLDDINQGATPVNESETKVMHADKMACLPSETRDDGKEGENSINLEAQETKFMGELHDHVDLEQLMKQDLSLEHAQVNMKVEDNIVQDEMPHDHSIEQTQVNVKVEDGVESLENINQEGVTPITQAEIKVMDAHQVACLPSRTSDDGKEGEEMNLGAKEANLRHDHLHDRVDSEQSMKYDLILEEAQVNMEIGDKIMQDKVPHDDSMEQTQVNVEVESDIVQDNMENAPLGEVKVSDDSFRGLCQSGSSRLPCFIVSDLDIEGMVQVKMENSVPSDEACQCVQQNEGYQSPCSDSLVEKVQDDKMQGNMGNLSDVEGDVKMQVKMQNGMPVEGKTNDEISRTVHHYEGYENQKVEDDKVQENMETPTCDEMDVDEKPCCGLETRSKCAESDSVMNESVNEKMPEEEDVGRTGVDDQHNANVDHPNDAGQMHRDVNLPRDVTVSETLDHVMQQTYEVGENAANAANNLTESNKDNALHEDTIIDSKMENLQIDSSVAELNMQNLELEMAGTTNLALAAAITKNLVEYNKLCDEKIGKENTVETEAMCVSSSKDNLLSLPAEKQYLVAILEKLTIWNEQQADIIRQLSERIECLELAQGKEVDNATDKRKGGGKRKVRTNRRGRPIYCK